MLDPDRTRAWVEHHFATITPEEFVSNVKRISPELAREMWGDRSVEDICSGRPHRLRRSLRRLVLRLRRSPA